MAEEADAREIRKEEVPWELASEGIARESEKLQSSGVENGDWDRIQERIMLQVQNLKKKFRVQRGFEIFLEIVF